MNIFEKISLALLGNLVWILFIAFFFVFSAIVPSFFTTDGILFIFTVASCLSFLVFGQAILLISGNLDLSIAQIAGLSTIITSSFYYKWFPGILPGWLSVPIIGIISAVLGGFNGFLVGKLKLSPFLATLATYFIYRWQRFYLIGRTVMESELPKALLFVGEYKVFKINISIFLMFFFTFVLYFILNHIKFGSKIYAVGGNQSVSTRLGINTGNTIMIVFILAGILSGISGMLYAGYTKAVSPDIVDGYVFLSFAGAIIGGISMSGGRGTIGGAIGGTLLIVMIDIGLMLLNMDPYIRLTLRGVFILIAIMIEKSRVTLINRILLPK